MLFNEEYKRYQVMLADKLIELEAKVSGYQAQIEQPL